MAFTGLADLLIQYNTFVSNHYLRALITLAVFFFVSKIVVLISEKIILQFTKKTKTKVDDLLVERTNKPISLILLFFGLMLAANEISFKEAVASWIDRILISLIIITIAYIVVSIFDVLITHWAKKFTEKTASKTDDNIISLLHKIINIVIYAIMVMYLLSYFGVEIGPLVASLGVAGIAIAFALQSTLGNIFGGMSLIFDKSVRVGDVVQINETTSGTVLDVGLRSTKIRTWDNEIIIIPNGLLADSQIHNVELPDPKLRVKVKFGVAYGSDVQKVKDVVLKEIKTINNIIHDPEPFVRFNEMGDSALLFTAYMWVDEFSLRIGVKEEATTKIYNALNKAKISIPFPQMDVYIKEHKK